MWERDQNVHNRLPRLSEKSGASGLLWTQRQLQYQTDIFKNLTQVPTTFSTTKKAVSAAYKSTYDDFHGFFVKQVFQSTFDAAPDAWEILNHMSLPSAQKFNGESKDTVTVTTSDNGENPNHHAVESIANPSSFFVEREASNVFEQVAKYISKEWVKLERFLNQCNGLNAEPHPSQNVLCASSSSCFTINDKVQSMSALVTARTTAEELPSYVAVVQPILQGLDSMLSDLNMKDPSRC
jgi:hypothetical protein